MQSQAKTVDAYLAQLAPERRSAIEALRGVVLQNLDPQFEEGMQYGMIGYYVPHSVYPKGYHSDPKQPLPFAGIASQKQHMALYLMHLYTDGEASEHARRFREAWLKAGKKLDAGKSCIRFRKLDDLPLDVIGAEFKRMSAKRYVEQYERQRARAQSGRAAR